MENKIKIVIIALVVIGIIFISGCYQPEQPQTTEITTPPMKPSSPLQVELFLSDKPLLNNPVTLALKFKSVMDASNISAKIELPDGFELVSGNLEWKGALVISEEEKQKHPLPPTNCSGPECEKMWKEYEYPSVEQNIEVVVKSTKTGYYQLKGSAISMQGNSYYFGDSDLIYIEITPNDAIIGSKPINNWYEPAQMQAVPMAENCEQIQSELIISQNPELNKEVTIIYIVTPSIDISDPQRTQMNLVFPPKAFEVINVQFPGGGETYEHKGQLTWKGSISKDQTVEIKAIFKVINTGWGSVYGNLNVQPSGEIINLIQDVKIADLYVDKYDGNFTIK